MRFPLLFITCYLLFSLENIKLFQMKGEKIQNILFFLCFSFVGDYIEFIGEL